MLDMQQEDAATARPWTNEEVTAVFALKAAGLKRRQIAQRLGRSFASVVHKLNPPKPTKGRSFHHYGNLRPLAGENVEREYRAATLAHVADIERVHGKNHRWTNLHIGQEPGVRTYHVGFTGSTCGSSAAMCAELGGSFRG